MPPTPKKDNIRVRSFTKLEEEQAAGLYAFVNPRGRRKRAIFSDEFSTGRSLMSVGSHESQ